MTNEKLKYEFEHWMEFHTLLRTIESNMVEVPECQANIGEREFHVGAFKISKSLVIESCWRKVMGDDRYLSRESVTKVSFSEISDFLQRLGVSQNSSGRLSIPTEAQLLLAQ